MSDKTLGALLFPGFELLDLCGPLEMFGNLEDPIDIILYGESREITSSQGVSLVCNATLDDKRDLDILLIPGGKGTRQEVFNSKLLSWIEEQSQRAKYTLTVCTGSALLAKTGLLDGRKATTNKQAFLWVKEQGPHVHWIENARWVEDDTIITSSGVAAGIDMSLWFIEKIYGAETCQRLINFAEYLWNKDPNNDPFSKNIP